MTPAIEKLLYENRPDLWGVTRCMIHCRDTLPDVSKAAFNALPEDDQHILKMLSVNALPEGWGELIQTL